MKDIILPQPQMNGGMPLMEAFAKRATHRKCSEKKLSLQQISDLLWCAFGFNREGFRTAPSSHNRQETELFVFMEEGTYLYDAESHKLVQINEKDLRAMTGTQGFAAEVPINVGLVADTTKLTGKTQQGILEAIYANAGFICENIYLYATQEGLNTVSRAMIDKEILSKALNLQEGQVITLVQSIGYPKEN